MFCPREALTHERTGSGLERTGSGLAFRHELNARSGSGLERTGSGLAFKHANERGQVWHSDTSSTHEVGQVL